MSEHVRSENKKRARENDDEEFMDVEQQVVSERPIAGLKRQQNNYSQHTNRRDHKRVKRLSPIDHLCQQMLPDICTLGEKLEYLSEDLELIGQGICANFYIDAETDGKFKGNVLSTLLAVALEQPQKRHVLGLLLLKVIGMSYKVGDEIVQFFLAKLKFFVEEQNWNSLKNCLGFLAVIHSCLPQGFIINVFESLLKLAVDLKALGKERSADMIYFNTCLLLPQLFVLTKTDEEVLKQVVTILENLPSSYSVEENDTSLVGLILPAVKKFIDNNFENLNKFYPDFFENVTILNKENLVKIDETFLINFPEAATITDNSVLAFSDFKNSKDFLWTIKRTTFSLFEKIEVDETLSYDTVYDRSTYESLIFSDTVTDFVLALEFNKFTTIKSIISLNNFFNSLFFAEQGISINSLTEKVQQGTSSSTIKYEDMAVESILGLLFQLYPNDGFFTADKAAYFCYVLVGVCFQEPIIAPVYGRAFKLLFAMLDDPLQDFDLKYKFLNLFTLQLRSFDYFWKWNDWTSDVLKNENFLYNNKISFVKDVIKKNLRSTSEPEIVFNSLPEEYSKFLQDTTKTYDTAEDLVEFYNSLFTEPLLTADDVKCSDTPGFVLSNEKLPFHESIEKILDFFKNSKITDDETTLNSLVEVLGSLEAEHGSIIVNFDRFIITIMVQAVLQTGSRSISHFQTCLLSNKNNLLNLYGAVSDATQINEWIIEAIHKYWNSNLYRSFLITELFYKNNLILDKSKIVDFLFKETSKGDSYVLVDTIYYEFLLKLLHRSAITGDNTLVLESFQRLVELINGVCKPLGINGDVVLSSVTELNADASEDDVNKFELNNKLKLAISLTKTLLRKFKRFFKDDQNNVLPSVNVLDSKVIAAELTSYIDSL